MITYNDEWLAHHGIKGQRWGIRRFQDLDGTLTQKGRLRYNDDGSKKSVKQTAKELGGGFGRASKGMFKDHAEKRATGRSTKSIIGRTILGSVGLSLGGILAGEGGAALASATGHEAFNTIGKSLNAGLQLASAYNEAVGIYAAVNKKRGKYD